jgi:lipid-A-disaccharide synthase
MQPSPVKANQSPRIFFSVGEPSGDVHGANLIRALREKCPPLSVRGFGGDKMVEAGLHSDFDLTTLAVVGFAEVLPKLREFFRVADIAEEVFRQGLVDGVVLIDFPGFNWHIAKRAKKYGLPVYYYLPPQLWAWGSWRIKKIRKHVDRVLCNIPFEKEWFESRGVAVDYVGHPFFDVVYSQPLDQNFVNQWSDSPSLQVAVLPGSRQHEVHRIWPLQLEIIRNLHKEFPQVRYLVAALKQPHAEWCRSQIKGADEQLPVEIFSGKTSEIISLADCVLTKSGSVSLELMAREKPTVVLYQVSNLTYALGKMLTRLKSMTLPNMIAGETIMPEFLAAGKSKVAVRQAEVALAELLRNPGAREKQKESLRKLGKDFAQPGASAKAAELLLKYLQPG